MLAFAPGFIPIPKHPGYLWEPDEGVLYSFKSGTLKALKFNPGNFHNHYTDHYQISTKGWSRNIPITYLRTLRNPPATVYVKVTYDKS